MEDFLEIKCAWTFFPVHNQLEKLNHAQQAFSEGFFPYALVSNANINPVCIIAEAEKYRVSLRALKQQPHRLQTCRCPVLLERWCPRRDAMQVAEADVHTLVEHRVYDWNCCSTT